MKSRQQSVASAMQLAGDDKVLPFHVAPLDVRGRAVQLGPMLNAIMDRHAYPAAVAKLLGEAIVLTVLLGTSLKFEGKFIIQAQGEGPVSLLVVDYRTPDAVRAYARFDGEQIAAISLQGQATPQALLGSGTLAMTIDQGGHGGRYQGIVELNGISLEAAAMQYFRQSEQIPTLVRLAVAEIMMPSPAGGFVHRWRAGGLLAQFLPQAPERLPRADFYAGDAPQGTILLPQPGEDDAWVEARALIETIEDDELTDPQIGAERLLFRLFHQHGVHVFAGAAVADKCSCSRDKIVAIMRTLPPDAHAGEAGDDAIVTKCEFCNTVYRLTRNDLA